jgi:chemotaxis protein CheZ
MPLHGRKVFRIEAMHPTAPMRRPVNATPAPHDAASSPSYDAITRELQLLRAMMERHTGIAATEVIDTTAPDAPMPISEFDRKAIEEGRRLKNELHLIYEAIKRTKQEIATLHVTGFKGPQMQRVTDELDAVIGGTETATQQILSAAEEIDENASALVASLKQEHEHALAADIQERVLSIFEACNFQDLTGQRINKVVNSLKFIESHVMRMIDIWGGMGAFEEFEPAAIAEREGDAKLLNGPKLDTDAGHASQDDIDSMFN